MIWLQLFYVYLKIGIFGFGGGYAMLSLIQADVVDRYGWISSQEFTDIVAISQMTPGPIGINSATYIGYTAIHNAGYSPAMAVLGSCLTTFAVCLPSFLLVLAISYAFAKFRNNKYVAAAFYGLRPASTGLIGAACAGVMLQVIAGITSASQADSILMKFSWDGAISWRGIILALVLLVFTRYIKKTKDLHPIVFIGVSAVIGVVFHFAGV